MINMTKLDKIYYQIIKKVLFFYFYRKKRAVYRQIKKEVYNFIKQLIVENSVCFYYFIDKKQHLIDFFLKN